MKIIVIGGFLGSGKTTILLELAGLIVERYKSNNNIPIVIIENEIGEVSVDSEMLTGFKVKELFAGCICCTLTSDLIDSIEQIKNDYSPEYIIIEATGLADPSVITKTINKYVKVFESIYTITIADASRWYEILDYMDMFLPKQMKSGDIMILNKIDLIDKKTQNRIITDLKIINPETEIYPMSANKGIKDFMEKLLEGAL